jgi:hypothetical protein
MTILTLSAIIINQVFHIILTQNNNQQDVNESVNRALDQTKDNINRSIEESGNQIPHYNNIVNSYQEQTLLSLYFTGLCKVKDFEVYFL